jgi:Flp pilus assembly protein TadD
MERIVYCGSCTIKMRMPNATVDEAKSRYLAGDYPRAEAACRAVLLESPDTVDALNLLGLALAAQGRGEKAVVPLQRALSLDSRRASIAANLATVLLNLGRADDAMPAADLATALEPGVAGFHVNRAAVLLALGRKDEALAAATRATELNSSLAEAHANRTGALNALNRYPEALDAARQWLALRPDDTGALNNEAVALIGLGREEQAVQVLGRALGIKPGALDTEMNLAIACLTLGRHAEGWRYFERRFETPAGLEDMKLMRVTGPRWGGSDPAGRRLLLHREQGLGDMLQFSRYAPLLQQRGAKILLRVDRPLCTLLRESFPGVAVYALSEQLGEYDAWAPLMSLPLLVPETMAEPPRNVPYLRADAARRAAWRRKLGNGAAFKVGLAWAGRTAYYNDSARSMNLGDLAPLAAIPGVELYSLQYGPRAEQAVVAPPFRITHFGAQIAPVEEMAALACELDLVISVDSMAGHLAGGLGLPCWVLLALSSDWRWLRGRDDSPWYPTVRLFRQRALGDWSSPLQDMALALHAVTSGDRSRLTRLCV